MEVELNPSGEAGTSWRKVLLHLAQVSAVTLVVAAPLAFGQDAVKFFRHASTMLTGTTRINESYLNSEKSFSKVTEQDGQNTTQSGGLIKELDRAELFSPSPLKVPVEAIWPDHLSNYAISSAQLPIASAGGPYDGTPGEVISFDGSKSTDTDGQNLSYSWNFGDGSTGTGANPTHAYTTAAVYTVSLTVSDSSGSSSPATTTATIANPPVANTGGPYAGTVDQTISFSGSKSTGPSGEVLAYAWNFGDGSTGTGVSPSHIYSAAGSYTIVLTVSDTIGGSNTAATSAAIAGAPVAKPGGPYSGTVSKSLTFSGSGSSSPSGQTLSYAWRFGDGSTGTGVSPTHSYTATGSYTVVLTVSDSVGGTSTSNTKASITSEPVASAGGPYDGAPGVTINFSAAKSTGPAGQVLSYAWNFGDGTTGSGVSTTHKYSATGSYTVTLNVSDTIGGSSSSSTTAMVSAGALANSGGPYGGTVGQNITFNGSGSSSPAGQTLTYAWTFGDGTTGTGVNPVHAFSATGSFPVSLTVTPSGGGSNTSTTTAAVVAETSANAGGPYSGTVGQPLSFVGSKSTGPAGQTLSYAWKFGDGTTGTGVSPTHAYGSAGTYTITLTVSDGVGGSSASTTSAMIIAQTVPVANAGGPYKGTTRQSINFSGSKSTSPSGQTLTYAWSFGDGTTGSGVTATHAYGVAGTYSVKLTVTDTSGATNSSETTATVSTEPVAQPGGPYNESPSKLITFNGSASASPSGQTLSYAWTFGDGATASGVNPTHSYNAVGVYTVTLTVSDSVGGSNAATTTATIANAPAANAGGHYSGLTLQTLTFSGSQSTAPSGQTLTYAWSFGDGSSGIGATPTHSYSKAGTFTISLTVIDSLGGSNTATTTATITAVSNPVANPGGPYNGTVSQSLSFNGSQSAGPSGQTLSYAWSFGDGTTGSGITPTHSYAAVGTYIVSLTLTDTSGATNTATTTATIVSEPVANAGGPYSGTPGQTITFSGVKSTGPSGLTLTYGWSFGDGTTGTGLSPTHSYTTAGNYTVSLTVTDASGGNSTATTTASIAGASGPPKISSFAPTSSPIGTLITVSGTNLSAASGPSPLITLAQQGGGTLSAPVSAFTATSLSFVIPPGAATGAVEVSVGTQSAASASVLTVTTSSTFSLVVAPTTSQLIQGQSTALAVTISSKNGFGRTAALTIKGVPSGVRATFKPASIAVGQTSVLTLTAPANQAVATSTLSLAAAATIDDQSVTQVATASLKVTAVSTSFLGRTVVDDAQQTPIAGVTVKFLGVTPSIPSNATHCSSQTTSDGGGNFSFTNLPTNCTGPQLISYDGSTATAPAGKYAGVSLSYTLVAGQVVSSPVLIHLPRIDNAQTVQVQQNSPTDQHFTFTAIPGLQVTVYAGTTLSLEDGSQPNPFPLVGIQIPLDRLPDAIATSGMLNPFIIAFQPANALASQPVAVNFPNALNSAPGSHAAFVTLNPLLGYMSLYGSGTVSSDGTEFIADPDPNHPGHAYGLVHFDWHGPMPPPPPDTNPSPDSDPPDDPDDSGSPGTNASDPPDPPPSDSPSSCSASAVDPAPPAPPTTPAPVAPTAGDPVDLSSGIVAYKSTDLRIKGGRGTIAIKRYYRTLSTQPGPFGLGTAHNYSYVLNTADYIQGQGVITLVMPDGNQFAMSVTPGGTFVNTTIPALRGAVLTAVSTTGPFTLRFANGLQYQFTIFTSLGAREAFLTSITDLKGNTTTLTLNPSQPQQIQTVTDPVGRALTFTYDASSRIIQVTDPIGRTVKYTYNQQDTLATFTDANGGLTQYGYDASNNLNSITDPRGIVTERDTYNESFDGRVTQQVLADGGTYKFAYTLLNSGVPTSPVLQTMVTDPLGNQTTYRYNPQGFLVSVTDASGQTRVLNRDPSHSNLVSSYTGSGACASCGNTAAGNVSFTFDAIGNVLTRTDALGNVATYTYDSRFDKVTSITDPLNHTTSITYDAKGDPLTITDANNHATQLAYDSYGELTQITDPIGSVTTMTYDGLGNVTSLTDALGNITKRTYDSASRLIQKTDALGHASTIDYDALDRVTSQTDPKGNTTSFAYDAIGDLLSVTDARGNATTFQYDSVGRLQTRTSALSKSESYSYDVDSNLIQFTDRRGQTSKFQYDALNRLIRETYVDATVTRSYDASGRLLAVNDSAGGDFGFTYDAAGRLLSQQEPTGIVQYTPDTLGRVSTRQVTGQSAVQYAYDPAGNLLSAAFPNAGVSYTYYATNLPQTLTRTNGVVTNYTFDKLGQVLSIVHSQGATALNSQSYTYDSVRNRLAISNNISQPLITLATTATVDKGNELLTNGETTYTSDANGNRLTETSSTGTLTYVWDGRNRLSSITDGKGNKTSMQYDFDRNLMVLSKTVGVATTQQSFVIDALTNVVSLTYASGAPVPVLTGVSIDSHYASVDPAAGALFGIGDPLGSIAATTNSAGALGATLKYEPYGQTTGTDAATFPFAFTGRVPILGNVNYFRDRYYDVVTGRFISEDPLGLGGGSVNYYAYAAGNPIQNEDPTGLTLHITIYKNSPPGSGSGDGDPSQCPDPSAQNPEMADRLGHLLDLAGSILGAAPEEFGRLLPGPFAGLSTGIDAALLANSGNEPPLAQAAAASNLAGDIAALALIAAPEAAIPALLVTAVVLKAGGLILSRW